MVAPDFHKNMFGNNTMSRLLRITLIAIAILLSPLSLLTGLLVLNTVNPIGLVFMTSCSINNKSGQDIWVSPIGAVGKDGYRRPLPFYYFKILLIRSPKRTDFHIAKDKSRTFVYNWDDIQFSEILVRPEQGDIRFIVIDPNPIQHQYRKLKHNLFTVPSLSELPVAPPNLTAALSPIGTKQRISIYGLSVLGLISPTLTIILWRTRKKLPDKAVE